MQNLKVLGKIWQYKQNMKVLGNILLDHVKFDRTQ